MMIYKWYLMVLGQYMTLLLGIIRWYRVSKGLGTIFGKCLNYKIGLRISIWPTEVQFFWSQRWALLAKVTDFRF